MPVSGPNSLGSLTWARDACSRRRYGVRQYSSLGTLKANAIDDALAFAHDRIAQERPFQWHRREDGLVTTAGYSDGTVDATISSAALSGTTTLWNTSSNLLARDAFNIGEGGFFRVLSIASDTAATLTSPYSEATVTGSAYSTFRDQYSLPSDFMRLVSVREIDAHQELVVLSRGQWSDLFTGQFTSGRPRYCFLAESVDSLTSTGQFLQFYPFPDAVYGYQVLYDAFPTWQTAGGSPVPGSPQAMEAFINAALSDLWKTDATEQASYESAYQRAVGQLSKNADRTKRQRIFSHKQWSRRHDSVWPVNFGDTIGTDNG